MESEEWRVESEEWRVESGEWRVKSGVAVSRAALLIKKYSLQGREFVGNGLDRSGTGGFTAIYHKTIIEYNTLRCDRNRHSGSLRPRFKLPCLTRPENTKETNILASTQNLY